MVGDRFRSRASQDISWPPLRSHPQVTVLALLSSQAAPVLLPHHRVEQRAIVCPGFVLIDFAVRHSGAFATHVPAD